jgi:S-adenosylmethionine:tRNA ribosyltransferase-isomerase
MSVAAATEPPLDFALPPELEAAEPPEQRGLARDEVRLLVGSAAGLAHHRFRDLPGLLAPGDLVVVNTSATVPAALDARRADGTRLVVHLSTHLDDGSWVVELRRRDRRGPVLDGTVGERLELAGDGVLRLVAPQDRLGTALTPGAASGVRLWRAAVAVDGTIGEHLRRHGRPITYGHLRGEWPLETFQTVFGRDPGSAEMPSAGRPFTDRLVTSLVTAGVALAPVTLHTGVSSLEAGELPQPERFRVPAATAAQVALARARGGRVVAVGTTVTRALESVAAPDGSVHPGHGWTDLVLGPDRPARAVDGLVTGWHPPAASHLLLLEAVAGPALVAAAYRAALQHAYRWHELGDSCLLLPSRGPGRLRTRAA